MELQGSYRNYMFHRAESDRDSMTGKWTDIALQDIGKWP